MESQTLSRRRRALIAASVLVASPLLHAADNATWDGTTASWSDPTHWLHSDPGAAGLVPNNGNGGFNYIVSIGAGNITQDIAAGVVIDSLVFANGSITGTTSLTLDSGGTWAGGAIQGAGTTSLAPLATFNLIDGPTHKVLSAGTLTNAGTIIDSTASTSFYLINGASLRNSGTLFLSDNALILDGGGTGTNTIYNSGLISKNGSGVSGVGAQLINDGTVDLAAGGLLLRMDDAGTSNGTFNAGGVLQLATGGTHTLSSTSQITGAGTAQFVLGSFNVNGVYNVTNTDAQLGTVNFNAAATTGTLNLTGATIGGTDALTVSSGGTWSSGTMLGAGSTIYSAGASVSWIDGAKTLDARTLLNFGTVTVSGGGTALTAQNGATIRNSGTILLTSDSSILDNGGTNSVINSGLIAKTGGNGVAVIGAPLTNSGTIQVSSGNMLLNMAGGAASDGAFIADASTSLNLSTSGVHDFSASSSFTGAGTAQFLGGGTSNIAGAYNIANTGVSSGIVNFNTAATTGTLVLSGGGIGGSGSLLLTSGGTWSGGNIVGTGSVIIDSTATLRITTGAKLLDGEALINNGTIIDASSGGVLTVQNGSNIRNAGTFLLATNSTILDNGGTNSLLNTGLIWKVAGGTSLIRVPVTSDGTVQSSSGLLSLLVADGGTSNGTFIVDSGGAIELVGATHQLSASSSVTGGGTVQFNSGTFDVNGTYSAGATDVITSSTVSFNTAATTGRLALSNGVLGGTGTFTVSSTGAWDVGSMVGAGTTVYGPGASVIWTDGDKLLDTRMLINDGTILSTMSTHPLVLQNGAAIQNNGAILLTNDATISDGGSGANSFVNNGLLAKLGGSGTTRIDVQLTNNGTILAGSGTIALSHGGTHNGTLIGSVGTTFVLGSGHTFTPTSVVTSLGTMQFSGPATLSGKYAAVASVIDATQTVRVTSGSVMRTTSLQLAGATDAWTSTLDLAGGELIVDYSGATPFDTIQNQLNQGRHNGAWDGNGITSSTTDLRHAVGISEASSLFSSFPADLNGQSVDGTTVIVKYTYTGDANLDGAVDIRDLYALASHFDTSGQPWTNGDFNYDSQVNVADLSLLVLNWQAGVGAPLGPSLTTALTSLGLPGISVPEPTSFMVMAPLAASLGLRRRRRRSAFST